MKSKETNTVSGGVLVTKLNYHPIEIPLGIRHYFFLNNKSKIFINISYQVDILNGSTIKFTRSDGSVIEPLDIMTKRNMVFGIGYKYKNKYSIETRYMTNSDILGSYAFWSSEYKTISVIFGYSLF